MKNKNLTQSQKRRIPEVSEKSRREKEGFLMPLCEQVQVSPEPPTDMGEDPKAVYPKEVKTKKFIYVFIRKDLPNPQMIVQACHSAIEVSRNFLSRWEEHPSVLVVGVNSVHQIQNYSKKVKEKGFRVAEFFEPLFGNELTSFAVEPVFEEEKKKFKSFNLIRESSFEQRKILDNPTKSDGSVFEVSPCLHLEYEVDYVETFAYEKTPKRVCKKCKKSLKEEPTDSEKEALYRDFFWEFSPTDEEVKEKRDGFNV